MKRALRCPCCNQVVPDKFDPSRLVESLPVSGHQRILARVLVASFGRELDTDLLIDALWSGPDGPPLTARRAVTVYAHFLRRHLSPYGITISGRGSRYQGSYRMHWLEEPTQRVAA